MEACSFTAEYETRVVLGFGSFGTVYQACRRTTDQLVAIKVLNPCEGGAEARDQRLRRFQREMAICARLHHPNIVRFIDSGFSDAGEPFAVFDFLPGSTLAEVLAQQGPLAPSEARHLMLQVLDGLSCAHAQGIVHRDIKPSNIMLVTSGGRRNAVILDFGIGGYSSEDKSRLTATGEWVGSASYSAPEQIAGHPPTPYSDLYSWALVFVECMTGKRVIHGATLATTLWQQLSAEKVPLPRRLRESALGRLLERVLIKDVARRAVTATDLIRELDGCRLDELATALHDDDHVTGTDADASSSEAEGETTIGEEPTSTVALVCCEVLPRGQDTAADTIAGIAIALQDRAKVIAQQLHGRLVSNGARRLELRFEAVRTIESAARCAARAAQQLVASLHGRMLLLGDDSQLRLDVRVGVHSAPQARAAEARDIAGALCASATSGQILVSDTVRDLIWRHFICHRAGHAETTVGAVATFALDAEAIGQRSDASRRRAPLVGRTHELALLRERWQATRDGDGQIVLVTGEPGVGKSRLLGEFDQSIAGDPHRRLVCRCVPESQASALAPIVELLDGLLRSSNDEEVSLGTVDRGEALAVLLARHGLPLHETYPLFADLLSLPHDTRYPPPQVSPQRHKDNTLNALVLLFAAIADRQPLLFVIEDLHWADPTTHALVAALVREPPLRMLGVWSARPELSVTWTSNAVLQIQLGGLSSEDSRALVAVLTRKHPLGPTAVQALIERCDGVPLFLEEMAYMVTDAGDGGQPASTGTGSAARPAIPETLRGMLVARFDRLGRARETAQVGAAIGREFDIDLLLAVSTLGAADVQDDLDRLVANGLAHRRRRPRGVTYQFRHALVRDAVYDTCADNSAIHGKIAAALEAQFPSICRTRPDLLAHHHASAGQIVQAIGYAQQAAERELARSAFPEALVHASNALEWIRSLSSAEAVEAELMANSVLIQALMATRGWAHTAVKSAADRSAELVARLDVDSRHRIPTLWFLFTYHHVANHRRIARRMVEQVVDLAERSSDEGLRAAAETLHGLALYVDGDHASARRAVVRAIELYDPELHRDHGSRFGMDTGMLAFAYLGQLQWYAGDDADAFAQVAKAIAWARDVDHLPSIALGLIYGCLVHQLAGHRSTVAAMAGEVLQMGAKYGLAAYEGYATALYDWATSDTRRAPAIVGTLSNLGCRLGLSYYASLIADGHAERGELTAALACIDDCLSRCAGDDEHFYEPDLHLRRALYLARIAPNDSAVRSSLEQARQLARRQDMPRVEVAATRELLRRYGCPEPQPGRLGELIALHPGLREVDADVNQRSGDADE